MKCSICEKEAVGFFVTRTYLVFNSPKIIEARCKEHFNYRNFKWRKKKISSDSVILSTNKSTIDYPTIWLNVFPGIKKNRSYTIKTKFTISPGAAFVCSMIYL